MGAVEHWGLFFELRDLITLKRWLAISVALWMLNTHRHDNKREACIDGTTGLSWRIYTRLMLQVKSDNLLSPAVAEINSPEQTFGTPRSTTIQFINKDTYGLRVYVLTRSRLLMLCFWNCWLSCIDPSLFCSFSRISMLLWISFLRLIDGDFEYLFFHSELTKLLGPVKSPKARGNTTSLIFNAADSHPVTVHLILRAIRPPAPSTDNRLPTEIRGNSLCSGNDIGEKDRMRFR